LLLIPIAVQMGYGLYVWFTQELDEKEEGQEERLEAS
jgi:hypothetical protein